MRNITIGGTQVYFENPDTTGNNASTTEEASAILLNDVINHFSSTNQSESADEGGFGDALKKLRRFLEDLDPQKRLERNADTVAGMLVGGVWPDGDNRQKLEEIIVGAHRSGNLEQLTRLINERMNGLNTLAFDASQADRPETGIIALSMTGNPRPIVITFRNPQSPEQSPAPAAHTISGDPMQIDIPRLDLPPQYERRSR